MPGVPKGKKAMGTAAVFQRREALRPTTTPCSDLRAHLSCKRLAVGSKCFFL